MPFSNQAAIDAATADLRAKESAVGAARQALQAAEVAEFASRKNLATLEEKLTTAPIVKRK